MTNQDFTMNSASLREKFFEIYGNSGDKPDLYFAPGRVNLIGEHTDYNGGFVLPCAIQYGTYMLIRKFEGDTIRISSLNYPHQLISSSTHQLLNEKGKWFNYPFGVMNEFMNAGFPMTGMDILYSGDIPKSAGLSSSASIEMVTAFALNEMLNAGFDMIGLARLSQKAENNYVGVNCGIMDQFAVGLGKKDHALFLNCHTMEYKMIPFRSEGYSLIIVNSNKHRDLSDSMYNERVSECQLAVTYISSIIDVSRLGELGFPQYFKIQDNIPDVIVRKRARHVVSENQRVLNSVNCLWKNDLTQFGYLMNASHESLKENYEVTGIELDTLVEEALKVPGVLGARMTGAGFGGCTINLVANGSTDDFIRQVGDHYFKKTGLIADFYTAKISDGVRKINEQ